MKWIKNSLVSWRVTLNYDTNMIYYLQYKNEKRKKNQFPVEAKSQEKNKNK